MVPEAPLEDTGAGLVAAGDGWFVLNAREGRWRHQDGRAERLDFEGEMDFSQLGVSLYVLRPGEPIGLYHWEADQEDFLVLSGAALLLVEGEDRPLRQWDFVHCPPATRHMILGAGDGPSVVLAVGAREHQDGPGWGGYPVDELALRHGAGVAEETNDPAEAYKHFPDPVATRYRDGWLPGP
ncbi:MAG: cupin domain-containing protein [Thermoleophilia bacterium]|nr:cupin domain-containing protein [Thermoleophilia bacterium]